MIRPNRILGGVAAFSMIIGLAGCGNSGGDKELTVGKGGGGTTAEKGTKDAGAPPIEGLDKLSGTIAIDGSSTVAPITSAASEAFKKWAPGVNISVEQAGTGAGMKKFINKEIEVCDASRPITKEELDACQKAGIEVVEIPIAYDGLTVVVNKKNTFLKSMTTEELRKLWDEKSTIKTWKEINPAWPATEVKLYGPTPAHGSFEYFTEVIVKTKKKCRKDYQQCTDYSAVADGVGSDEKGLGYLGLSYAEQNADKLSPVSIDSGKGPVAPSKETVLSGTYTPLTRPLMIYTTKAALAKEEVKKFLQFVISSEGQKLIESKEVGYVKFPDAAYKTISKRIDDGTTGSILSSATPGSKIEDLFK